MKFDQALAAKTITQAIDRFYALYPDAPKITLHIQNQMSTYQRYDLRTHKYSIHMGLALLHYFWENGYRSRPKRGAHPEVSGVETVHLCTLHELAHVLQMSLLPDDRSRLNEKPHTARFYRYLRELETCIPYQSQHPIIAKAKQQLSMMFAVKGDN